MKEYGRGGEGEGPGGRLGALVEGGRSLREEMPHNLEKR